MALSGCVPLSWCSVNSLAVKGAGGRKVVSPRSNDEASTRGTVPGLDRKTILLVSPVLPEAHPVQRR